MDTFAQIAANIIKAQEAIIGPVALEQASRVPHLKLDWEHNQVNIDGDEAQTLNSLINVYQELFGPVSKEVSKEAAASLIDQVPADQLPEALR